MIHVVLWFCIAACVSVLVGIGVALTARPRARGTWYTTFVLIIAVLAAALVLYAWQYVVFVYLDGGAAVLEVVLFSGVVAAYAALAVLVPLAALQARKARVRVRHIAALAACGVAVAIASVFGVRIEPPLLRRFVLAARYVVLAGAFFWSFGTSFSSGGASTAPLYTRFSLASGIAFGIIAIDSVVIRFSLASDTYVPDGVVSLLLYGMLLGPLIARLLSRSLGSHPTADAVAAAFLDAYGITRREAEIIRCLMNGSTNNEIGEKLYISPRTVDTHFSNIYRKCGVRSRLELARLISDYQ